MDFFSAKSPYSPVLVIEVDEYIGILQRDCCRYFVNEVPVCLVALAGLDIPDQTAPPNLVVILGPGHRVNYYVRTLNRGIVIDRSIGGYDKLRCRGSIDCGSAGVDQADIDKQEGISCFWLLGSITPLDLVWSGCSLTVTRGC